MVIENDILKNNIIWLSIGKQVNTLFGRRRDVDKLMTRDI